MRILDVGSGAGNPMKAAYPDADIVRLDADADLSPDVVMDLTGEDFLAWEPERFDMIWMSHVLEHLSVDEGRRVTAKLADLLNAGGQLHIKVPSLEWAAEQIVYETGNRVVGFHLFGGQFNEWQFHKWGYTLPQLRYLFQTCGLIVAAAQRGVYQIGFEDDIYNAEENVVVGVKPEG